MEIIYENNNAENSIRLFFSNAKERKNNVRIHYHSMIELSLVIKGQGLYKTSQGVTSISPGDIFLYRPNEMHCITDIDKEGMQLLNLHLSPLFIFTNFPNSLNSSYIKILNINFPLSSNKLNDLFSKEEIANITACFLEIKNEVTNQKLDYLTAIINNISSIFIKVSRLFNQTDINFDNINYQKILTSINYINENFTSPPPSMSLEEISSIAGYNRCYFSHLFNKIMGMNVWEYLCIKRIEKALTLIKTTNKSVIEIANECGFNNTTNFNKIFKKYTNVTPREFRK